MKGLYNLTELKDNNKINNSDSQTVKATDMTNLKELVNELHKNKITPPRDNFKYWSTNLPTVKGDPIRGKVTGKTEEEVYQKLAKFYGIHIIDENATIQNLFYAWYNTAVEDGMEQQTFERCEYTFEKYYVKTGWCNRKIKNMSMQEWKYFIENTVRDKIPPIRNEKITKKEYGRLKDITSSIISQARADGLVDYEWGSIKGGRTGILGIIQLGKGAFAPDEEKDDVYQPDEMAKIIEYCKTQDNPKAKVLITVAITGLRVGEVCALTHKDIDVTNAKISVHSTETKSKKYGIRVEGHTKTKAGTRDIKVRDCHKPFLADLYFQSSNQPYVFMHTKKNKQGVKGRIRTQDVRRYLVDVCNAIGITYKKTHAIRKYYGSEMKKSGVPDEIRKVQLGHTQISTTEKYYDRDIYTDQEKADYINRVSGI